MVGIDIKKDGQNPSQTTGKGYRKQWPLVNGSGILFGISL